METNLHILSTFRKLFDYYRDLGEKAMTQIRDEDFDRQPTPESNSIAVIVKHISGNMISRFTDFLDSDGEKTWRNRDAEFEEGNLDRQAVLTIWERGWKCFYDAMDGLAEADLNRIVYIRNQGHTVFEALSRQLAHYPYHIGQMVYVGRMLAGEKWQSLSIPKNGSQAFNDEKFAKEKEVRFFVDKL